MTNAKILIVQDDHSAAAHLAECLTDLAYTVCAIISSGQQAIEKAAEMHPDLVLIDLGLEGEVNGVEVAEQIGSQMPVVYLVNEVAEDLLQRAEATQPFGYVIEPIEERQLHLNIQTALSLYKKESEMEYQTQRLQTIMDGISDGVIAANENGDYLIFNSSAKQILRTYIPSVDINQRSEEYGIFFPDRVTQYPSADLPLRRAIRGESTDDVVVFIRNPNLPKGTYLSVNGRPLRPDEDGTKGGVIVFRDIKQDKETKAQLEQAAGELRDQTQLLQTVINSISDGVVAADSEGKFTIFNSSAEEIVGIGGLDLPPEQWTDQYGIFLSDQKTPFPFEQLPLLRAIRGENTDDMELFIRNEKKPDGVSLSVSGRPLSKNVDGHGGGVVVFHDITERKNTEDALKKTASELQYQKELIETAFNSISDGIFIMDLLEPSMYMNPSVSSITGIEELKVPLAVNWGRKNGVFHTDRKTPIKFRDLPLSRILFRGASITNENLFIRNKKKPDGVYIQLSGQPIYQEDGEIRGAVATLRDITEQMINEEALRQAFDHGRLEVLDTILHNIGNAINSVTTGMDTLSRQLSQDTVSRRLSALANVIKARRENWVDYIQNDPQGQQVLPFVIALAEDMMKQRVSLKKICERVCERTNHIADIIRTQKSTSGLKVVRKDLHLESTIQSAIHVLRESLERRNIKITVNCENAPREIRVQESQFYQMMINLIKNAMEAIDDLIAIDGLEKTPCISIHAYTQMGLLNIDVSDNGIGISPENNKKIFSAGYSTKKYGSGLGLHSVANFIIGSGGQVQSVSDGIGSGTTIKISLRLTTIIPQQETE